MTMPDSKPSARPRFTVNEDWLSVFIAFLLIIFSVIGLLGPNGIKIIF
jgi:hypothetical protein